MLIALIITDITITVAVGVMALKGDRQAKKRYRTYRVICNSTNKEKTQKN